MRDVGCAPQLYLLVPLPLFQVVYFFNGVGGSSVVRVSTAIRKERQLRVSMLLLVAGLLCMQTQRYRATHGAALPYFAAPVLLLAPHLKHSLGERVQELSGLQMHSSWDGWQRSLLIAHDTLEVEAHLRRAGGDGSHCW